jgi:hypothetical protein
MTDVINKGPVAWEEKGDGDGKRLRGRDTMDDGASQCFERTHGQLLRVRKAV